VKLYPSDMIVSPNLAQALLRSARLEQDARRVRMTEKRKAKREASKRARKARKAARR